MDTILHKIGSVILTIGMTIASWFGVQTPQTPVGGDSQLFLGGSTYTLAGSGITSSATSLTLTSLTLPQNGYVIQDSDLAETFFLTVEPGNTNRQEFASCTTVTQNSAGTATLSGCSRGLSPISPYTASTTLQFSHAGGSKVIFSNPPQLYNEAAFKSNDETITGIWDFSQLPTSSYNATSTSQLTTKNYVDNVSNQGAATSTTSLGGISRLATQGEMASSSWNGNVDDPLVVQNQYMSAAPTTTPNHYGVVTRADQTIDPQFIATSTTDVYVWGGETTFNASTTFNTNPISFNSRSYTFPSVENASSSVLMTDGSGGLSWGANGAYLLMASTTDSVANSTSATNTLIAFTIPANTLGGNGVISGRAHLDFDVGTLGAGNDSFGMELLLGTSIVAYSTSTLPQSGLGDGVYEGDLIFHLIESAATTQEGSFSMVLTGNDAADMSNRQLQIGSDDYSATVDTSSAQILRFNAIMGDSNMSLTVRNVFLELIK